MSATKNNTTAPSPGSDTSDEQVDVASTSFDPIKALYSPKFKLDANASIYNNVATFVSALQ